MRSAEEVKEALTLYRVPNRFVALFRRALAGGNQRAVAIRAHCLECQGFSFKGVLDCEVTHCLLHPYRKGREIHSEALKSQRSYHPGEEIPSVDAGSKGGSCDEDVENKGVTA